MRNIPISIILVAVLFVVLIVIYVQQNRTRAKTKALQRSDSDDDDLENASQHIVAPAILIGLFLTGGAIAIFVLYLMFQTFGS